VERGHAIGRVAPLTVDDLRALVGTNTGTTFRHGDAVTVKIAAVNTALRRADFVLVRERALGAAGADAPARGERPTRAARGQKPGTRRPAAAKSAPSPQPASPAKPKSSRRGRRSR